MRMLHVKGWGWLEGDTKWTPESPAKMDPRSRPTTLLMFQFLALYHDFEGAKNIHVF